MRVQPSNTASNNLHNSDRGSNSRATTAAMSATANATDQGFQIPAPEKDSGKGGFSAWLDKTAAGRLVNRTWHGYEHGLGHFVGIISQGYRLMGEWIARHPVVTLLVTLLAGAAICAGWARFRLENSSDVLWVPQSGKARDDKAYIKAYYPQSQNGASFYAQLKPDQYAQYGGDNALQIPVTWEMFQLHNAVLALTVTDDNGANITFADICYRALSGGCRRQGYLNFWGFSFENFLKSVNGSETNPAVGNEAAFRNQVSQLHYPDGSSVSLLSVFGGTTFQFTPEFRLAAAQVIASDYTLDDVVSDATAKRWHDAFKDLMLAKLPTFTYMDATFITGSSVGEELSKSINNDMKLIIISFIVFIIIAVVLLSKVDSVATRTTLALLGVGVTCIGIVSGWGWGLLFGMPFTPLQQLSPFILLGMGIDVLFILVKAYDIIIYRDPGLTIQQAFGQLMATAGMSVQVTLLASAVAFALGAVSSLNSVRWFSAFATLNTMMIMIMMMTLFIACFALTERRIASGRRDCCCCAPCARDPTSSPEAPFPVLAAPLPPATAPVPFSRFSTGVSSSSAIDINAEVRVGTPQGPEPPVAEKEQWVKYFFRVYYAPLLAKWYIKILVFAVFVGYAIVSFFGIYRMQYGQPLSDLAPDGSYLQDYDAMFQSTYAQQVGAVSQLYFRDFDVSDPVEQGNMMRAYDRVLGDDYINASATGFQGNWYITFNQFAANQTALTQTGNCFNPLYGRATGNLAEVINPTPVAQQLTGCVPQDQFYPLLNQFLSQTQYAGFKNDVILDPSSGSIITSRMSAMQVASAGNDKYSMNFIRAIRHLEDDINSDVFSAEQDAAGTYVTFMWNSQYLNYEGDSLLSAMALEYFVLALVGLGIVVLLMLVNPWTALLMMCAVGLVDLYLFGELWILSVKFNQVSVINMIMATGLAVDYSVYFAQKFMTVQADGTLNGRMQLALADTGSAVFLGGMTALCGSVPMAFSKSIIIRTFFKLIFGTILFSMLVGLVLLPVVCSVVGPPPVKSALMAGPGSTAIAAAPAKPKKQSVEMV